MLSLLLSLVSYDDEGAAVLVFGDLGWREGYYVSLASSDGVMVGVSG